jgi:hypothetical protein
MNVTEMEILESSISPSKLYHYVKKAKSA